MKDYLKKITKKVLDFLKESLNKKTKPISEPFNPYKNVPDPAIVFKDTLGMNDINRDSKIPENLKSILIEIENMGDRLRKLGESDGPYQLRYKTIKEITNSSAERTSRYIETIFKGIGEGLKTKKEIKRKEEARVTEDVNDAKVYLDKLIAAKYWLPKNFLLWEIIIFFVFGITLLGGDFVLSLTGTKEAFLLQQWEAILMSLGITACSIYIKVYYDDYLLSNIERTVTRFKHENLNGISDNSSESKLRRVWHLRTCLKTLFLLIALSGIYFLGELRYQVLSAINPTISSFTYSRITFVILSVLFPLIGGICIAMAIKKMRGYSLLWTTKRKVKKNRKKLYEIQEQLSKWEQDLENCNSYIEWSKTTNFIEGLTKFLFSCYLHGYEYAFRKHNMKLNVIEKAKEIRRLFSGDHAQLNDEYPL